MPDLGWGWGEVALFSPSFVGTLLPAGKVVSPAVPDLDSYK